MTTTPEAIGYRPTEPTFVADPYPVFARLRDEHPVIYDESTNQWLVSRFQDVNALLRDRRLGRTFLHIATYEEWGRPEPPPWQDPFWHLQGNQLIDMEPPDHTRLRRLVSTAFTPRTVANQRPRIERLVDRLVESARSLGEFDLIADLIEEVPVNVIADMLGVPAADRRLLRPWSADITLMFELNTPEAGLRRASDASEEFATYMRDLVAHRRAHPGDDLLSELAQVADAGDHLTDDEVVATAILLLNAGHEASVNGAGNSWWALFRHPDALTELRADPALLTTAVDELLRFDTPAPMFERWVLENIEVAGVRIPRGQELALLFASANRDAAEFPRPDEIVLDRRPNPHLAFGAGIHYCLGAPLAKLELEILYRAILERLPTLELVAEPSWKPRFVLRGLTALPVRVA